MAFDVVVERGALADLLKRVAPAAATKASVPILTMLRLAASAPGWLAVTATDLDMELTGRAAATVRTGGALCVDAGHLADLVAALPAGSNVELKLDGNVLVIRCGRTLARFQTLPDEDFPRFDVGEPTHGFALAVKELADGLDLGGFAHSTEEARYYLNGVFLHEEGETGELRFVSTDGHRLARHAASRPEGAEGMPGVIVPSRAIALLRQLAAKAGGECEVAVGPTKLRVTFGGDSLALSTKLIDGTFPDYERVIPPLDALRPLGLGRAALEAALKRVTVVCEDQTRAVRLDVDKNALELRSAAPGGDEVVETLEVAYDGPALTIGFNARYLLDGLGHVAGGDEVELMLGDAASPAVLRAPGAEIDLVVLMPLRV